METRILIASWLFLIGSGLFMIDAVSEIAHHFSPMALLHLSEGVLFVVGSIFFMPPATASKSHLSHPSSDPGRTRDLAATDYTATDYISTDYAEG